MREQHPPGEPPNNAMYSDTYSASLRAPVSARNRGRSMAREQRQSGRFRPKADIPLSGVIVL